MGTLDWEDGFSLKSFACVSPEWTFQFSQLKGSSDDGNATLKLHFSRPLMKDTVTEEVICPKLQELLFFMHSFLTAKVASLDPSFMPPRPWEGRGWGRKRSQIQRQCNFEGLPKVSGLISEP